jgi:hypothetical protein
MSVREGWTARAVRVGIYAVLVVWTAWWLIDGWAYLQAHSSVVQHGFGGDGVQLWEVFNIKMVAAHHAIRWLGGVLPALGVLYLLQRRTARGTAASAAEAPGNAVSAPA